MRKAKVLEAAQEMFQKELRDAETDQWVKFLRQYSAGEVEVAFEQWYHKGRYFPRFVDITELVSQYRATKRTQFVSCGICEEGWIRVFEGKTVGGDPGQPRDVDPKLGAMKRCECFQFWARS